MAIGAWGVITLPNVSQAAVTAVQGSAYGYRAFNITLFGGAQADTGPTPTVSLVSDASNSPQSGSASTGLVQYGPATLFTSDSITVGASGSIGPNGSVNASTSVNNINKATTQPSTGSEILTADNISGTCSNGTTLSRSTSITNGMLQTDSGLDLDNDGDYIDPGEHPPVVVSLPASPAANFTLTGHTHLSGTSTDYFTVVFNEQTTANTVNAVHEYFGTDPPGNKSTLKGDLIIAQAVCGMTGTPDTTSTTSTTTTTVAQADLSAAVDGPADIRVDRHASISAGARNNGPSTADSLSFTVTFPASFSIAKVTEPRGATCTPSGQTFTCTVDRLAPRKSAVLKATGSFAAPGPAITDVSVTPGTPPDPDSGNNTAQLQTNVT